MSETVAEGGNVSPGSSFGILHIGEGDKEVDYYQGKDASWSSRCGRRTIRSRARTTTSWW